MWVPIFWTGEENEGILWMNGCGRGIGMAQTEAQARAVKKYHDKFDDIKMRVPKGERQVLQDHAESQGESLNAFLYRAAKETIEHDNQK